jgi:opacity protein-like surface antigen
MSKVEQLGDPVVTYGVYTDYAVGDNLLAGGAIDYWDKSTGTIADTTVRASDLSAALDLKYIFTNVTQSFRPYLVAGAAAHRFEIREKANQTKPLESNYRDAVGKFGLDYGGGVSYRFDRSMDAVAEIRYRNIMDSSVALSQLAFTGGLNYIM